MVIAITHLLPLMNARPKNPAPFMTSGSFRYLSEGYQGSSFAPKHCCVPIYTGVFKAGWEIIYKEIAIKPSYKKQ
jgi:hypothetical protein